MNIAVTGATGYVGRAVTAEAARRGHRAIALSRHPADRDGEGRRYDLRSAPEPGLLDDVDAVVHCAYDLSLTDRAEIERVNVEGTRLLINACQEAAVSVCLVSSMSAYTATRQIYGLAKLASERDTLAAGGLAVRLGLVYGGEYGGMAGTLRRAATLPVVPLIGARSHQFVVHVSDMSRAIVTALETGATSPSAVGLAHPQPVYFEQLVRGLATAAGRNARILRVPWQPLYVGMLAAERLGISLPVRSDSILGLVHPAPSVPGVELWRTLGVEPLPFDPRRP